MTGTDPLQAQLHDALYREGAEILWPYLPLGDGLTPGKPLDPQDIERGVRLLSRVLEMEPGNWSALWVLGMTHRISGRPEQAYQAFRRAYELKPDQVNVGRELVLQCCMNGRGAEAMRVSEVVLALRPGDASLLSNHALAQVLAGDVEGARRTVERALAIIPENKAAQGVRQLTLDIQAGRVTRPDRWPWDEPKS